MTSADPHDFYRALDASTRGLWSVYDSYELPVHASVWVGQIGSVRPVSQEVGEGLWSNWLATARDYVIFIQRNTGGGVYLGEAQGAGAPTEPRTEPLVCALPCLADCFDQ